MSADRTIVLFDGVCNLCSAGVQFIIARDRAERFAFASLQSAAGRRILAEAGVPAPDREPDTMIVVDRGRVVVRSDAAMAIARGLPFPWPLLALAGVLPRGARDAVYGLIARHRYRWFGKQETCVVPTAEVRSRFVE